jgi:hypothetical protein
MTAVAISQPTRRLSRRQTATLTLFIAAVAAVLYFEYRTFSRVAPNTATEADTMCMAARFGLGGLCG